MNNVLWDLKADKIINELKDGKRIDGRKFDEYREIKIQKDVSQNADGSARVKLGNTDVIVGVKMVPGEPYPDMPAEGSIAVGAELLAIASPTFDVGPPREDSIELARVVDRGIREGKAIDFKELCIREGELVWIVFIDTYVLNDEGNMFDSSSIAALVALLNTQIPKLEDDRAVPGEYKGKLKISRKPILNTFAKISNTIIADPLLAEEKAADARFSVATTEDGYISAFQKGGGGSFLKEEIDKCIDTAFENSKKIRSLL